MADDEIFREWFKAEFEQNWLHLRDRDQRILDVTKFYTGLVCSVGAACLAILNLGTLEHNITLVGVLLSVTAIVGIPLLVWLMSFRRYFVQAVRQVNALRRCAISRKGDADPADLCVHSTDPGTPRYWRSGSSHMAILALVTFINSSVAATGVGTVVFSTHLMDTGRGVQCVIGTFLAFTAVAAGYAWAILREGGDG